METDLLLPARRGFCKAAELGPRQIQDQMQMGTYGTITTWLILPHQPLPPSHLLAWPCFPFTFRMYRNLSAHVTMYDHTEKEGNFGLTHGLVY